MIMSVNDLIKSSLENKQTKKNKSQNQTKTKVTFGKHF